MAPPHSSPANLLILVCLAMVLGVIGDSLNYRSKEDPPDIERNFICPKTELEYAWGKGICASAPDMYLYPGEDYSPWTHRPMCVDVKVVETGAPDGKETYCIFTDANFADGRGITIFSTMTTIKEILASPAFTDPKSIKGLNDLVNPPMGPPPYEARSFPGRGIGLVANRTIYRGELVMQETPSLIYDRAIFNRVDERNRIPLQWHGVYQLSDETRDELLDLHKHHGGDEIDDLMRTNAFGAYYLDADLHNNLLPRISRFNHDCRPNAHYYFDSSTMAQYVHAVRNIYPGEEVLINYTDAEYTYEERQAATMVSWGFSCQCSVCHQPPGQRLASDKRLRMIKALKELLNDWTEDKPERPQMAELLVELYELERLDVPVAQAYETAAYGYSVVGDELRTMKWATKAVEAMTILYGGRHPLTKDLEVLMLTPREHRTWLFKAVPEDDDEDESSSEPKKTAKATSSKSEGIWGYFSD